MDIREFMPPTEGEKPLDRLVTDGGFCGIFRRIACVGDSLSSGEFEARNSEGKTTYHDFFDYSWGQYLARMAGSTVLNFSRGGMTASEYCESFGAAKGFWDPEKRCQAYIIALGVNDLFNRKQPLGEMGDICAEDPERNAKTFTGYYARLVAGYKAIAPDAKFFFVSTPRSADEVRNELGAQLSERLCELAAYFGNSYVIDLHRYAPVYDEDFRRQFFLGGHLNPAGYLFTARMIASYIDYLIRAHMDDFRQVGFIGTPYRR